MNKSLVLIFVVLTAASARKTKGIPTPSNYREGDRQFQFPGDNNEVYLIDINKEHVDQNVLQYSVHDNGYWLYTRMNPTRKQILKIYDKQSVYKSYFDAKKTTVFTSHGWLGDGNTEMNVKLTKAFLEDDDVNVIVLDWSKAAKTNYITATCAVPGVGRMLGKFISWLSDNFGLSLSRVHLVGFSLGGHVVGNAGRVLGGKVKRITALDPAGPLWLLNMDRLVSTDGRYVEVIHTNAFEAGFGFACGDSDHYPNGGSFMPGCHAYDLLCNHNRAWKYLASSIKYNNFRANKCYNALEVIFDDCTGPLGHMGNSHIKKRQSGIYRVNTKAVYPYFY